MKKKRYGVQNTLKTALTKGRFPFQRTVSMACVWQDRRMQVAAKHKETHEKRVPTHEDPNF